MYIYLTLRKQMSDVKLLQLHSNTWKHLICANKWLMVNIFIGIREEYLKAFNCMQMNDWC